MTRNIFKIFILLAAMGWSAVAAARTIDQIPNVHLADSTRFVSDPDGYLSADAIRRADAIIGDVWRNTTAEVVAVIVKDLSGEDIDRYAIKLTDKWGIGKRDKDNGLLLLVSIDDRKAGIYTGYGVEGVMPDVKAATIRRDVLNPDMRRGDYDSAIVNTLSAIAEVLNDPEAADELRSDIPNKASADDDDNDLVEFFLWYLGFGGVVAVGLIIWLVVLYRKTSGMERHERYEKIHSLAGGFLAATVGFLGVPLAAFILLLLMQKRVRRSVPKCPNCAHPMRLIDEVHDNEYLTPAQDHEEQLGSVDYDVWLCDNCGDTEIYPYINHTTPYRECPACHTRAEKLASSVVVRKPTTRADGLGEKRYVCSHCGHRRSVPYTIAKLVDAAPVLMSGGRGGGFGGGGGGFGGGSFGGGRFGGGGSSGSW